MKIEFYDGSFMYCSKVEFIEGNNIILDDVRIVPIIEIQRIVNE